MAVFAFFFTFLFYGLADLRYKLRVGQSCLAARTGPESDGRKWESVESGGRIAVTLVLVRSSGLGESVMQIPVPYMNRLPWNATPRAGLQPFFFFFASSLLGWVVSDRPGWQGKVNCHEGIQKKAVELPGNRGKHHTAGDQVSRLPA